MRPITKPLVSSSGSLIRCKCVGPFPGVLVFSEPFGLLQPAKSKWLFSELSVLPGHDRRTSIGAPCHSLTLNDKPTEALFPQERFFVFTICIQLPHQALRGQHSEKRMRDSNELLDKKLLHRWTEFGVNSNKGFNHHRLNDIPPYRNA